MGSIVDSINFSIYQIRSRKANKETVKKLFSNIKKFKTMSSNDDFDSAYDSLWGNGYFREQFITSSLFPQKISEIGKHNNLVFNGEILYELRWQLKLFEKNEEKLVEFLKKKSIVDDFIIEGKYSDALHMIEDIESKYGVSFWTTENRMLFNEKMGNGTNSELIKEAGKSINSPILFYFDMKARGDIEADQYDYITSRDFSNEVRVTPEKKASIDFCHYMVAPFSLDMNLETISNILSHVPFLPLIDRYLCVVDILEYFFATGYDDKFKDYLSRYLYKLRRLSDDTINTFSFIISDSDARLNEFKIVDDAGLIKNLFIKGSLEECYIKAKDYIQNNSIDINIYNFFIETCFILGKEADDILVSEQKKSVLRSLSEIYTISDNYSSAIEKMKKLCFGSLHSRWGRDIFNVIPKYIYPLSDKSREISIKYSNLQKLTVETVYENLNGDEALSFLKNGDINSGSDYLNYCISMLENDIDNASNICGIGPIRDLLKVYNSKRYEDYEKILGKPLNELHRIRIARKMWENMEDSADIEKGIDYFLHLFFEREEFALIAPIKKFISYIEHSSEVDTANIRVPILYYILSSFFDNNTKDKLTLACEDFFLYNNISKPSHMSEESKNYDNKELIYFLRYICVPHIMGPVLLAIKNPKDLDYERISICQFLRVLDPNNVGIYDDEIKETTHKLFINEKVSSIASHKIQVNIEGIKSRINKDMNNMFGRYKYTRNPMVQKILNELNDMEGMENTTFFEYDHSKILEEIVKKIRNEFVKGEECGLDSYLSINIRHGMLTAQLRAPITKNNLYTEKDIIKEEYNINPRWLYCIKDKRDERNIREAIIAFSQKTDNIIDTLKNKLIRISTEEHPTEGLFDYSITDSDVSLIGVGIREDTSYDDFIDMLFDILWKKTDENLTYIKSVIREKIMQQYNDAFNELLEAYDNLKKPFPDAKKWITETKNEMEEMLEKVCDWFERSNDNQFPDFDISDAFNVGLKTIQNIHPEMTFTIRKKEIVSNTKIAGKYWKYYSAIFVTLLENVSEHAREIRGEKNVDYFLRSDEFGVYIKMQNDFDCSKNYSDDLRKINEANRIMKGEEYLSRVNEEGGTGIPKINKIFKVDLSMDVDINCLINDEDELFIIEIEGKKK